MLVQKKYSSTEALIDFMKNFEIWPRESILYIVKMIWST